MGAKCHSSAPLEVEQEGVDLVGCYAHQSHLIRDFREFTGGTPADFLARSTPAATLRRGVRND